jgi:hypothetical protein
MRDSRFPLPSALKLLVVALAAAFLSACANSPGIIPAGEVAHISRVQVSAAPGVSSARFTEMLQARTTQHAERFGRAGAPKELRIVIERHKYKNPAMALLVGDANEVGGRVAVIDVASGRMQGQVEAGAIDAAGVNGVVGAIVAAAQDKQKVDDRLADGLAKASMRLALGSAIVDPVLYKDDPIIYSPPLRHVPPSPGDKVGPAAKPAPTPVAAKQERTVAVATPPSAVR